jgi:hypothetical protein
MNLSKPKQWRQAILKKKLSKTEKKTKKNPLMAGFGGWGRGVISLAR